MSLNNNQDTTKGMMLQMIGAAVFGSSFQYADGVDWGSIFKEMSIQKVAGIPCDIIKNLPMDDQTRMKWVGYCINQQIFYQSLVATQTELCTAFEQTGIEYVILKGMSAAIYYPVPGYRTMGDIDILIRKEDLSRAEKVLSGLRFNRLQIGATDRHFEYKRDNVEVELHFQYTHSSDSERTAFLEQIFTDTFDRRERKVVDNFPFYMLPACENGMVLLQHIYQHLVEYGVGLRQVMDWMLFVHNSGMKDWTEFNTISRRAGLFDLQKTLTKMCEKYMGLPHREDISWCEPADESVCDELIDFILNRGNFGNKLEDRDLNGKAALFKDIPNAFKRLQRGGMLRWKAAQKHRILKPFVWLYQLGRITVMVVKRDNPIEGIKSDLQEAGKVNELLDKLGLEKRDS